MRYQIEFKCKGTDLFIEVFDLNHGNQQVACSLHEQLNTFKVKLAGAGLTESDSEALYDYAKRAIQSPGDKCVIEQMELSQLELIALGFTNQ